MSFLVAHPHAPSTKELSGQVPSTASHHVVQHSSAGDQHWLNESQYSSAPHSA